MVERLPSIPVYKLLTALYTGVMACLCSWAIFITPDGRGANMTVLAPIWALVSSFLNIHDNYDQSLRSIAGAFIGLFFTELIAIVITAGNTVEYDDWIGVAVAFPVCFLMALGDVATGSKLSNVFRSDVAMEAMYIPIAFPGGRPFLHGALTAAAFMVGSTESFIATSILNAFNLLPRKDLPAIPAFAKRAADYYETLTAYWTSGMEHNDFVDRQRKVFEESWRAASREAPTPELRSVIYRMASGLIALRDTMNDGRYSEGMLEHIWHPLMPDIVELRLEVVYWLRTTAKPINTEKDIEQTDLMNLATELSSRLSQESISYSEKVLEGESSLSPANDIVRFQFAMSLIAKFAVLSDEFYTLVRRQQKAEGPPLKWYNWWGRLTRYLSECKKYWIHWWHLPFWAYGNMTLRQRLVHPLRLSITITAFAFPLVAWAHQDPLIETFGFWALVPLLFCFLGTPGASLVKGTRRIVGTILAACLGMACIEGNYNSVPAYVVEMFVAVSIGKLGALYSNIDYAGTVFAFTWMLVGIVPTLGSEPTKDDMITWALWRLAMTLIGTVGNMVVATFVFPTFAFEKLNGETAHELMAQSQLVSMAIEQLCAVEKGPCVNPDDKRVESGDEFFKSGDYRYQLLPDAKAEELVLNRTAIIDDTTRAVIKSQYDVDMMGRSSMVAHTTISDCTRQIADPTITLLLDPLRSSLHKVAIALNDSASKMALKILDQSKRGSKSIREFELPYESSQVNVEMQRALDIFVARREVMLAGDEKNLESWASAIQGGLYGLFHSLYTLRVFVDEWVHMESRILGLKPASRRSRALTGAPEEWSKDSSKTPRHGSMVQL
ncbi:hypothetical protein FOL47_010450 [Perkinsus chesapeaki]|uniref:Aluminum-activated malate transporter 1 n=1 Tax=Perkinsus chesapeaki TaxID=330153 RepID=A0A7J6MPN9_PERCH|nr:hypothetical protein FOL47_010450 [Perkinsus chesapeaki]